MCLMKMHLCVCFSIYVSQGPQRAFLDFPSLCSEKQKEKDSPWELHFTCHSKCYIRFVTEILPAVTQICVSHIAVVLQQRQVDTVSHCPYLFYLTFWVYSSVPLSLSCDSRTQCPCLFKHLSRLKRSCTQSSCLSASLMAKLLRNRKWQDISLPVPRQIVQTWPNVNKLHNTA